MYFYRDNIVYFLFECVDFVLGEGIFKIWVRFKYFDVFDVLDVDFEVDQGQVGGNGIRGYLNEDYRFVVFCFIVVVYQVGIGVWNFYIFLQNLNQINNIYF